jgi:hypothetical protein
MRYSGSLRVFAIAIKKSTRTLMALVIYVGIAIIVWSSLLW